MQWFHRSVQWFHTFLEVLFSFCFFASKKVIDMSKRIRISNERLNSYGFRVLTSGIEIAQYERNPVLLYMHQRGNVIGYVRELKVENDEITGELVFDEATDLSRTCKKQFEFGSLRMVSPALEVLELSEDGVDVVEGQTRATIKRSKLVEVSLVDIGANDDAIVLHRNGKKIELGNGGEILLPMLNLIKDKEMDVKELAQLLGLPEDADASAVKAKIKDLLETASEKKGEEKLMKEMAVLKKQNEEMTLSAITSSVDAAISERKIQEGQKEEFVALGKKIGNADLRKLFDGMQPALKLSSLVGRQGGAAQCGEYTKLSDVPSDKLMELREKEPERYKKLYREEYGIECEF